MQTMTIEQKRVKWAEAIKREAVKMLAYVHAHVHGNILLQPDYNAKVAFAMGFTDMKIGNTKFIGRYDHEPVPTDCAAEFAVTAVHNPTAPDAEFIVNDSKHLEIRMYVDANEREMHILRQQIILSIMRKEFHDYASNKLGIQVTMG